MPTRLLLEGTDLRNLLEQVREEHGPAAKIVSAERVRSGKLFSGPRFELTVELPGGSEETTPAVDSEREDLLALLSGDRIGDEVGNDVPSPVGHAATAAFSEVLAQLRDAAPSSSGAGSKSAFNPATFPTATPAVVTPPSLTAAAEAGSPAHATPPAHALSGHPAHAASQAYAQSGPTAHASPSAHAASQAYASPSAHASSPALAPSGSLAHETATAPGSPAYTAEPAFATAGQPAPAWPAAVDLRARLQSLGLPPALALQVGRGEAYPAMVRAFATQPEAPCVTPVAGDVIVIVGEIDQARAAADDAVRALRLGAFTMLVASPAPEVARHMEDAGDAARRARRQRGADHPTLVVVDAADPAWAREVIGALRADAVWTVVDAGRKPVDSAHQVAALGRVDAIVVRNTATTADPATPLSLGLPVALIDDRAAGPHVWAALLSERLFNGGADVDR